MPRAAGSSHVYQWRLGNHESDLKLPSVTHIIKFLKDELGFGGMAYWGMKIGVWAALVEQEIVGAGEFQATNDPVLESYYEQAKATGIHPNAVRDEAGESGTGAHELLEHLAIGDVLMVQSGDDFHVMGEPEVLAPIRFPEKTKTEQRKKWIDDKRGEMKCRGKQIAAAHWWVDNEDKHGLIYPELPVHSLRHGYAGTMDFARGFVLDPQVEGMPTDELEIVDYKSHKPSQGMRKDGTYPEGKGPAYLDDLMQTRAYGRCVFEMGIGIPVAWRVVLLQPEPDDNGNWYYEDTRTVPFELFLKFKDIHDDLCRKPECQLLARAYRGRER